MSNNLQPSRPFELAPESMSPRQAAIHRRIVDGPRGRVPINLRIWLHNPDFADVVETFGLYVGEFAPLTNRQKEIIILVGATLWRADYEWHMHRKHARNVGITDEQIQAIHERHSPGFEDRVENLTYELAAALVRGGPVPQDVYESAMETFGHKGVSDVIGLMGLYSMVGMTLNFYAVPAPTG